MEGATSREPRRYPVGMQTFSEIRERGYAYIDKTDEIYRLAHGGGKAFFLSRPRRFGKSLLLSTMQAFFEGRRELFDGLALGILEQEWRRHPVIHLDMSTAKATSERELRCALSDMLRRIEEDVFAEGGREAETLGGRLQAIIERMKQRAGGESVVVLVDEYDAPLLNVLDDAETLETFRRVMRGFYIPLKACDADLRFVFLTGITKFSQVSIFSELNNLIDISMNPSYAAICGITQDELETQLSDDVDLLAGRLGVPREEALLSLKEHYDGYHFCEPSPDIYNPFSLLHAFFDGAIGPYWFESGTPVSLIKLMQGRGWSIADLEGRVARATAFDAPAERMTSPLPMLYQAGYLTIKAYDRTTRAYTLGVPNREVSQGLSESLRAL